MSQEIESTGFTEILTLRDNFVSVEHKLRASFNWRTADISLPMKDGFSAGGTFTVAYCAHPDIQDSDDLYSPNMQRTLAALGGRDILLLELSGKFDIFASILTANVGRISRDYRAQVAGQPMSQRHQEVLSNVDASTLALILDRPRLLNVSSRLLLNGPLQKVVSGLQKHISITKLELVWSAQIGDNENVTKFHQAKDMRLGQGEITTDGSLVFDRREV